MASACGLSIRYLCLLAIPTLLVMHSSTPYTSALSSGRGRGVISSPLAELEGASRGAALGLLQGRHAVLSEEFSSACDRGRRRRRRRRRAVLLSGRGFVAEDLEIAPAPLGEEVERSSAALGDLEIYRRDRVLLVEGDAPA